MLPIRGTDRPSRISLRCTLPVMTLAIWPARAPSLTPFFPTPKRGLSMKSRSNRAPRDWILKVREHFDRFAGSTTWLIDKNGMGKVRYDYTYSGKDMNTREAGVRFELKPACDELAWRRWSEWDVFPEDSICRTEGQAKALRTGKRGTDPEGVRPTWPWSQDQTELGTADFRSIKFNIYEASLRAGDGTGLRIHANADAHVRSCLAEDGVLLHVLSRCPLGQVVIKNGDRLSGEFRHRDFGREELNRQSESRGHVSRKHVLALTLFGLLGSGVFVAGRAKKPPGASRDRSSMPTISSTGRCDTTAEGREIVGRNRTCFNNRPLYCQPQTDGVVLAGDRPFVRLLGQVVCFRRILRGDSCAAAPAGGFTSTPKSNRATAADECFGESPIPACRA